MSEQKTAKNLRLEDDQGESATYIRLEDTGRDLADRWRLQAGETPSDWQPVEYDRPARGGVGWILPLLIGLVVVGVAGLMIFLSVDRLRNADEAFSIPGIIGTSGDPAATDNDNPDAAVADNPQDDAAAGTSGETQSAEPAVVVQATDAPEPDTSGSADEDSGNAEAATEPEPEPTKVLIEEEVGIVNNQYGVNARLQPSTTAEVLRILEQDEEVTILNQLTDEENGIDWLQVLTSEEAEVWVAEDFIKITTRLVAENTGEVDDEDAAEDIGTADLSLRVTISSPNGLNARTSPAPDSEIIQILEDGRTFTALQRSDDGQWVQVELDDGETGWIFLQLVIASDDLSSLPSISETESRAAAEEAQAAEDGAISEDEDAETQESTLASDDESTADADSETTDGDDAAADAQDDAESEAATDTAAITVLVASEYGVNARPTTSTESEVLEVLEPETEYTAISRTEDSTWVQIPLEDGTLVWVFTQALTLPDDISALPVVVPPAVGDPAETQPQPLEDPVPEADASADGDDGATEDDEAAGDADAATDNESVDASDGVTSTVPLTLTTAVTQSVTNTSTTSVETEPITATESITVTDAATTTIDSSVLVTATESITSTEDAADGDATATIISLIDAKARPTPNAGEESIEGIPNGEVLPALGRTSDGFWVQVKLSNGTPAWVFANNVELSVDISDLPEVELE